jgi:hypothetical protein
MPFKETQSYRFAALTWDDLNRWAGGCIVRRGRGYQQGGRVSGLAMTDGGDVIGLPGGSRVSAESGEGHGTGEKIGGVGPVPERAASKAFSKAAASGDPRWS